MVYVDNEWCTGCGACVAACPIGAIHLVESEAGSYAEVDQAKCRNCEACLKACPEGAIVSQVKQAIEGKLMRAKPAPVRLQPKLVGPRPVRSAQAAPRALPLVGGAITFAGREILPRVVTGLLDAWDRRAGRPASAPSDWMFVQPAQGPTANLLGRGMRRRRRRRGGQ